MSEQVDRDDFDEDYDDYWDKYADQRCRTCGEYGHSDEECTYPYGDLC